MEKLNAKNRLTLEPGDRLLTSGGSFEIVRTWRAATPYGQTAVYITLKTPDGFTIYGDASSKWYKCDLVRSAEWMAIEREIAGWRE